MPEAARATSEPIGNSGRRSVRGEWILVGLGCLGLLFFFFPTLRSGFRAVSGDLGDTRLLQYLVEHSWLWLTQRADHSSFWDLPIFHPWPNLTAYSETLLTAAPPYWIVRALGFGPNHAYQAWLMFWAASNYAGAALLLRRLAPSRPLAVGAGAFLFAFGGARAIHFNHAQLLPQAFSLLCLASLAALVRDPRRHAKWGFVVAPALVAQLWAGFYLAFFLMLGLAALCAAALIFRAPRMEMVAALRRGFVPLALGTVAAAAMLAPLVQHYARVAEELPVRRYDHTLAMIPTIDSWLRMGSRSWLYGWLEGPEGPIPGDFRAGVPIGAGWFTGTCAMLGLWRARREVWIQPLIVASILLLLVTMRFGEVTAWRLIWLWLPGASAARAVFRVGILLLVPLAIGATLFLRQRRRAWVAGIAALVMVAEQATTAASYDAHEADERAAWVAQRVGSQCSAFFFVPRKDPTEPRFPALYYHIDAMQAQLLAAVPTLNGYSGQFPPGWPLYEIVVGTPEHSADVAQRQREWMTRNHLDAADVCVIEERIPFH